MLVSLEQNNYNTYMWQRKCTILIQWHHIDGRKNKLKRSSGTALLGCFCCPGPGELQTGLLSLQLASWSLTCPECAEHSRTSSSAECSLTVHLLSRLGRRCFLLTAGWLLLWHSPQTLLLTRSQSSPLLKNVQWDLVAGFVVVVCTTAQSSWHPRPSCHPGQTCTWRQEC